jgi:hypothetical protein
MDGVRDAGGLSVGSRFSGAGRDSVGLSHIALAVWERALAVDWALRLRLADINAVVRSRIFTPLIGNARDLMVLLTHFAL